MIYITSLEQILGKYKWQKVIHTNTVVSVGFFIKNDCRGQDSEQSVCVPINSVCFYWQEW